MQVDYCKSVVEVFAESAFGNGLPHVAVGGGDDSDVCLSDLARAYRQEFVRFQYAEQTYLHLQRQFAHLVKEERSAVGGGKVAFAVLHASRICPLDVSEEFAFDGSFGDGTTVHRQVFPGRTWAEVVDDARDDFLSHTVFTLHQYGKVRLGHLLGGDEGVVQSLTVADDAIPFLDIAKNKFLIGHFLWGLIVRKSVDNRGYNVRCLGVVPAGSVLYARNYGLQIYSFFRVPPCLCR